MADVTLSRVSNVNELQNQTEWYYEKNKNSDYLLITVGDSWTWGNGLGGTTWSAQSTRYDNKEYRTNHIYGKILSDYLNADHINVGLIGGANLYILQYFKQVISSIVRNYKKIYVVFTLTEAGRELCGGWFNLKDEWTNIRGDSWPTYDDITNFTYTEESLNFALDEMKQNDIDLRHHVEIYLKFRNQTDPQKILSDIDAYSVEQIILLLNSVDVDWILAKNFCNFSKIVSPNQLKKRWVDIISEKGNIGPYINNVLAVTNVSFNPFLEYYNYHKIKDSKQNLLEVMEHATEANNWLDASPYNSKNTLQHPLDDAHQWWAEYLYENMNL
jgi:hypothetical protein